MPAGHLPRGRHRAAQIDGAFAAAGIQPQIALAALDSDVLKAYVQLGLGVGIIAPAAFDPHKDEGLVMLDAAHLFAENTTLVAIRRNRYLRAYALDFLQRCCAPAEIARAQALRPQDSRAPAGAVNAVTRALTAGEPG